MSGLFHHIEKRSQEVMGRPARGKEPIMASSAIGKMVYLVLAANYSTLYAGVHPI